MWGCWDQKYGKGLLHFEWIIFYFSISHLLKWNKFSPARKRSQTKLASNGQVKIRAGCGVPMLGREPLPNIMKNK